MALFGNYVVNNVPPSPVPSSMTLRTSTSKKIWKLKQKHTKALQFLEEIDYLFDLLMFNYLTKHLSITSRINAIEILIFQINRPNLLTPFPRNVHFSPKLKLFNLYLLNTEADFNTCSKYTNTHIRITCKIVSAKLPSKIRNCKTHIVCLRLSNAVKDKVQEVAKMQPGFKILSVEK